MKAKKKALVTTMALVAVIGVGVLAACSPLADAKDTPESNAENAVIAETADEEAAEATKTTEATEATSDVAEDKGAPVSTEDVYMASYSSDDPNCLITSHKALGLTCMDCHDDETIAESGNYTELVPPSEDTIATREFCLNEGCHSWDAIVDSVILDGDQTVYDPEGKYNVHDNHRGDVDCGQCHSMHTQPTLNCVYCHYMDLPEGWDGFE